MTRIATLLYHGCRLVLGGLFVYAGAVKSQDVTAFAGEVANYQLLPYAWNYLVAATLPYVEVLAGGCLLANRKVRPAALLIGALTLLFMVVLGSVLVRGLDIDCGCFRPGSKTTPIAALLRDLGILLLAAVTFGLRGGNAPPQPPEGS